MLVNQEIENKRNKNLIHRTLIEVARPLSEIINQSENNSNNISPIFKNLSPEKKENYLKIKTLETSNTKNIKNLSKKKSKSKFKKIRKSVNLNTGVDIFTKRVDVFGNEIIKNGKHKVTFIDKISKNNIAVSIKVMSFKEYNKMEKVLYDNKQNSCCLLI